MKVETWRAAYVGVVPQKALDELDVDEHEPIWARYAETDGVVVFVVEREDRVIGFSSVGPCQHEPDVGELYAIYVRPSAWGTGAGQALMNAAVDALAERWEEAVLWVAEENPRARRFYERCGWAAESTRVAEVAPGASISEVLYRRSGLDRR